MVQAKGRLKSPSMSLEEKCMEVCSLVHNDSYLELIYTFSEEHCYGRNMSCEGQKGKSMHFNNNRSHGLTWLPGGINNLDQCSHNDNQLFSPSLISWLFISQSCCICMIWFSYFIKRNHKEPQDNVIPPFHHGAAERSPLFPRTLGEPLKTLMMAFTEDICQDWNNHVGGNQYCRSFIQEAEVWSVTCEFKSL